MHITPPISDKNGQAITWSQFFAKVLNRVKTLHLEFAAGFLWWFVGYLPSHCLRRFFYKLCGMKIGKNSTIHMMARIYDPRFIKIGQDSLIGEKVTLDGRRLLPNSKGELVIGNHVDIASEVMIWTSQHDIHDPNLKPIEERVEIKDYVFIGPRVIILPGVTVYQGAVIAAGAVVTKDVPENTIVAGVPAQVIGHRQSTQHNYTLGRPRMFQ